jgi:MraZ protein
VDLETPVQVANEPPRGRHQAKLDDKGRLKLPVVFQEYLNRFPERKLFVTSIDRINAQIYPITVWRENERLLKDFKTDPQIAKDVAFNANDLGADAEMDAQGRILFNTDLRQELDMEGQTLHLYIEKSRIKVLTDVRYQAERQARAKRAADSAEKMEMEGLQ